jgi:hypothetical protein
VTFIAPTFVNDNPVERTAKLREIIRRSARNANSPIKPTVVIAIPMMSGLIDPILETIKPEVGPNIRSTIAKGNCTYPASAASSPKPKGGGFLTSMGIV